MLNIRMLYTKFYQTEVFKDITVFGDFTGTESKKMLKTGFKYVFSNLSDKCLLVYLSMRSESRDRDNFRRIFKNANFSVGEFFSRRMF